MPRRRVLALVFAVAAAQALTVVPGRTLPVGPPTVRLSVEPTADPLLFRFHAEASDPDGGIESIQICVEEGGARQCQGRTTPPSGDPVDTLDACLHGREAAFAAEHLFSSFGIFRVTATATAGGCPVLGAREVATATASVALPPPPEPIPCAKPGTPTATDTGVTEETIALGSVVPASGPYGNFLAPALKGMVAAVNRINATNGVCDRDLALVWYDDGGDAVRGKALIKTLVEDDRVFALVAMPSWDALQASIPYLESAGVPVVGTTGQSAAEFTSPSVWASGPANASFGSIVVHHAYAAGARTFALVWVGGFGREIADAVRNAIGSLPDATLRSEIRASLSEADFGPTIARMKYECGGAPCDAVLLALDPVNVVKYFYAAQNQAFGKGGLLTSISPHGFNGIVAGACPSYCAGVLAWTGFQPPMAPASATVARYLADLRTSFGDSVDPTNPFVEAAYAATILAAEAMGRVGVHLTRIDLKVVLDSHSFDLGLTAAPLSWATTRHANRSMRGYAMTFVGGEFAGWRDETGWLSAP